MTIKLLIMDNDGVICDSSKIHLNALNKAIATIDSNYCISVDEDFKYLGTVPTAQKLEIITKLKGLPVLYHAQIIRLKKQFTLEILHDLPVGQYFKYKTKLVLEKLKLDGYKIYLASNTNREFIEAILAKTGMKFDNIYCNEDVTQPKPHPEIYLKCFLSAGVSPDETIIFEDSATGQEAAIKSGAHLFPIENPEDLEYDNINSYINTITSRPVKWHSSKITVVIPMAGEGSRFSSAGWNTPKPLIQINNLPMFATVIRDLNLVADFIFIIKKEHEEKYHLTSLLHAFVPNCTVIQVTDKQKGAASTVLEAKRFINSSRHLLISNADQVWDWNSRAFYQSVTSSQLDGSIVTFEDKERNPKWSFVKTNDENLVTEVAEKKPISDLATAGIYYFARGSDFVKYAEQMISENFTINDEYYVAPVYNFAIQNGLKINTFQIERFWPTGTPEELSYYLNNRETRHV